MERAVVVGDGPPVDTIVTGLADAAVEVEVQDAAELGDAAVAIAVGTAGADRFQAVDAAARETGTPWVAVELGGVGGYPVVDASVAGFDPDRECYNCLAGRVEANADPETEPVGPPDADVVTLAGARAARAIAGLLGDGEGPGPGPLGHVVEIPHERRRFLPLPGCDCAPAREHAPRRGYVDRDLETAVALAEQGLDERVGIVSQLGEVESYPAAYYLAQLCDTSGFSDATAPRQAAGVSLDWNEAFMKALGESLERYAAAIYDREAFERASRTDLEVAVSPAAFVRPSDADVDDDTVIDWLPAANLATGGDTYVPASLVVHPPAERPIRPAITTGLGLGSSGDEAILSGLYETIERDATMLAWYSTYEPLELRVDDERYASLAERVRAEGPSVTSLLVTQDVDVPVVATIVHDDEFPRAAAGSAAHLDPNAAARAALEEAVQNWMELSNLGPDGAADAGGAIGEFATDPSPLGDWLEADGPVPAASVGPDEPPKPAEAVDAVVERLREVGLTAYAVRTTTRDLEELGFEGVRVLVPAAQPLFLNDSFFGDRARSVPDELGFEPRRDRHHHPFP